MGREIWWRSKTKRKQGNSLIKILVEPKNSLIKQYQELFKLEELKKIFDTHTIEKTGVWIKDPKVLVSVIEGVGKGLLARICSRILGSDNVNENANYKHLTKWLLTLASLKMAEC